MRSTSATQLFDVQVRVSGIEQQQVDHGCNRHGLVIGRFIQHMDDLHQFHLGKVVAQGHQLRRRNRVDQLDVGGLALNMLLHDGLRRLARREQKGLNRLGRPVVGHGLRRSLGNRFGNVCDHALANHARPAWHVGDKPQRIRTRGNGQVCLLLAGNAADFDKQRATGNVHSQHGSGIEPAWLQAPKQLT